MSLNNLGLGFMFRATDMASGIMENIKQNFVGLSDVAGKSIEGLDGMVRKLGAGLTMTAVGVAGLASTYKLAGEAGKLEAGLAEVQKVTFASAKDMAKMERSAHVLARQLGRSPLEVTRALKDLATQGYTTAQSLDLLPKVLKLASAGDIEAAEAAGILGQALKGMGIDYRLATEASDQMQAAANAMAINVGDLRIGFGRLLPGVHSVGGTLTDALTVFGLAKNALGSIQISATASSLAFERLANPKNLQAMRRLGVEVLDMNGNFKNVPNTLAALMEAMKKLPGEAARSAFLGTAFGADGKKGVEALFAQLQKGILDPSGKTEKIFFGKDAVNKMRDYIAEAVGTVQKASDTVQATFDASKRRMSASWESMVDSAGKPFIKVWQPIVTRFANSMDAIGDAFQNANPKTLEFAAGVTTLAFAVLTYLGVQALVIAAAPLFAAGWAAMMAPVFEFAAGMELASGLMAIAFSEATWGGFVALLGSLSGWLVGLVPAAIELAIAFWPVTLVLAGIAALVYAVQNNLGGLGDAWDKLVNAFVGSGDGLGSMLDSLWNYFSGLFDGVMDGMSGVLNMVSPLFKWIGDSISGLIDEIRELFSSTSDFGGEDGPGGMMMAVARIIGAAIGFIGYNFGLLLEGGLLLVRGLVWVANQIKHVVAPVFKWVGDLIGGIQKGFGFLVGGLFDGPAKAVEQAAAVEVAKVEPQAAVATTVAKMKKGRVSPSPALVELGVKEGWATRTTDGGPIKVEFDYEKMTASLRAIPIIMNMDGHKVGEILRVADDNERIRRGYRPSSAP